jgi:hypothetical protein
MVRLQDGPVRFSSPVRAGPISGVGGPAASCHCCRAFFLSGSCKEFKARLVPWRVPGVHLALGYLLSRPWAPAVLQRAWL